MHPPILLIFTLFLTATADPLPLHSPGFTAPLKRVWTLPRRSEGDILYRNRVEHGRRRLALATGQLKLEKQFTRIGIPSLKGNQVDIEDSDDEMKALLAVSEAEEEDGYHSTRLEIESMDIGYVCKTFIGTPLREFNMLVDSGSADFWVPREGCMSESGKKCAHTTLGSNSSSTFRSSNDFFFISYGSGDVLGSMANDTLSIADLQLKEYRFGTVVIESDYIALPEISWDGIMGFGKPKISREPNTQPLLSALYNEGLIPSPIVSFKIPRFLDHGEGEMTLGALNPTRFKPETVVTLQDNGTNGFWEVHVDKLSVNGVEMFLNEKVAILDTGTTLIIVPPKDAELIHDSIPGSTFDSEEYRVPCNSSSHISVWFGGKEFDIDPRDMAMDLDEGKSECYSGIAPGDIGMGEGVWLMGDTFLKNVYMSLNMDTDEVTLAKLV